MMQVEGLKSYLKNKIDEIELVVNDKVSNLRRLQAQRNELNAKVRLLREELQLLQEQCSYVGEVVKPMDKKKVLVKVHPEGKFVVDIDKNISIEDVTPNSRVALRNDSYVLHKILPNKVDPLVSLMMVEKVPDSTYEMVGGLDKQIKEIKEVIELPVKHPELFEALGIEQPKVSVTCAEDSDQLIVLIKCSFFFPGCSAVRSAGYRQNAAGQGSCTSHRMHLHTCERLRAGTEVHRRRIANGSRAVRDGQRESTIDYLHGRNRFDRFDASGFELRFERQRSAAYDVGAVKSAGRL